MELDASLQVGAAGEIVLESTNKHALRKGKLSRTGTRLLQGFDIDEASGKPVAEQARVCLRSTSCAAARPLPAARCPLPPACFSRGPFGRRCLCVPSTDP